MDRKSDGIEFNREAFVASTPKEASAGPRLFIGLLLVVSVAALGLIVYKVLIQNAGGSGGTTDARVVAELDQRLSMIEDRLDQREGLAVLIPGGVGHFVVGPRELPVEEPEKRTPAGFLIRREAGREEGLDRTRISPVFDGDAIAGVVPRRQCRQRGLSLRCDRD